MHRLRRVSAVWNWLPAFRAVAELQSIQRAAEALHVSAPALSRTIKLLEDGLGQQLLRRRPAGVELTAAGERLLGATRDAIRLVDDALLEPRSLTLAATSDVGLSLLARALPAELGAVSLRLLAAADVAKELSAGLVDLVVTHGVGASRGVEWSPLPPIEEVLVGHGPLVALDEGGVPTVSAALALAARGAVTVRVPRVLAADLPVQRAPGGLVLVLARRFPLTNGDVFDRLFHHVRQALSGHVRVDEVV